MLRVKNNPMSTCSITQRCIFSKFATIVPFLFPRKLSHSVSASLQQVKLLCWQPCRITISIPAQIESSKWDLTCAVESANRMLWLCMRKKVGTIFAKFERKHLRLVVYESFGHPILFPSKNHNTSQFHINAFTQLTCWKTAYHVSRSWWNSCCTHNKSS